MGLGGKTQLILRKVPIEPYLLPIWTLSLATAAIGYPFSLPKGPSKHARPTFSLEDVKFLMWNVLSHHQSHSPFTGPMSVSLLQTALPATGAQSAPKSFLVRAAPDTAQSPSTHVQPVVMPGTGVRQRRNGPCVCGGGDRSRPTGQTTQPQVPLWYPLDMSRTRCS